MKKMTLRTLPVLMLAAFSGAASASAFQLWEQNASGLGTAYAGSAAVADNASTVFFNPAGMTQLNGMQVSVGVSGVGPSFEFNNEGSSGRLGGGSNGGNAGGWAAVPNAYFSWQLSPAWYLGFGVSAPFGLSTEYNDSNWIGAYRALKSEIKTVNYNPSVAYKLNDKISLGFGVDYQTIEAEMSNLVPLNPSSSAVYRIKGDGDAWGWNAGALFTLSPAMRVGLSYRSSITHKPEGSRAVGATSVPAKAELTLPDTVILSVWQQVSDRWEAMGDLSYSNWSKLDKVKITYATGAEAESFNYKDAWRIAWGAAYRATDNTKLKFGVAYDTTPTTNNDRSARVPDNDRIWFSLGGQWNAGSYGKFDLGYSYIYLKDPTVNQTKALVDGSASTLRGRYDDSAHVVGLQYSVGF